MATALLSQNKSLPSQSSNASGSIAKRLQQELMSLMMSNTPGISAFPDGDNLMRWIGTIKGGIGTVSKNFRETDHVSLMKIKHTN